jgi:hypothetical protein
MTEPEQPKPPRPDYEVMVTGTQDGNTISYEMKVFADDPAHASEQGFEWAQHHTDDWTISAYRINKIKYYGYEA